MNFDDKSIVKHLKKRNQDAFKYVIDIYIDAVHGLAYSILNSVASKEDIEECVEDVFVEVWNKIDKYDAGRGSLKTWILILCKYKALNIRKSLITKNNIIQLDEVQASSKENLEEEYLNKENKAEVLEIINSFNKADKEIFLRRYLLDQSIEDICTIMNLTRQAVDNRLWRGRKIIKERFNDVERRWSNG